MPTDRKRQQSEKRRRNICFLYIQPDKKPLYTTRSNGGNSTALHHPRRPPPRSLPLLPMETLPKHFQNHPAVPQPRHPRKQPLARLLRRAICGRTVRGSRPTGRLRLCEMRKMELRLSFRQLRNHRLPQHQHHGRPHVRLRAAQTHSSVHNALPTYRALPSTPLPTLPKCKGVRHAIQCHRRALVAHHRHRRNLRLLWGRDRLRTGHRGRNGRTK